MARLKTWDRDRYRAIVRAADRASALCHAAREEEGELRTRKRALEGELAAAQREAERTVRAKVNPELEAEVADVLCRHQEARAALEKATARANGATRLRDATREWLRDHGVADPDGPGFRPRGTVPAEQAANHAEVG